MSESLPDGAITIDEMSQYVENSNSFGFELRVFQLCEAFRLQAWHGEIYPDPISGKERQFDIRARREIGGFSINLAIECKTISPSHALLVNRVRRERKDNFYDLVVGKYPVGNSRFEHVFPRMDGHRISESLFVGRGLEFPHLKEFRDKNRVERFLEPGRETDIYDRWSQAVASAHAWLLDMINENPRYNEPIKKTASLILPILVVSDGSLWALDCEKSRIEPPKRVKSAELYLNKKIEGTSYSFSQLHIFTYSGLEQFLDDVASSSAEVQFFSKTFRTNFAALHPEG